MSRHACYLLVVACAVSCAGPALGGESQPLPARKFPAVSQVKRTSPESTIRSFVAALNARNLTLAAKCVRGAENAKALTGLKRYVGEIDGFEVAVIKTSLTEQGATVSYSTATIEHGRKTNAVAETTQLVRTGKVWQITAQPDWDRNSRAVVTLFATIIRYPEIGLRLREAADVSKCMNNLKQIALASMQFTQDYGDRLAFTETTVWSRIDSNVKSKDVYRCLANLGSSPSYSFNGRLSGVSLERIANPASTVLFYEGSKGRLAYRHGFGRLAGVAFADGHVQVVSASQAKTLAWKP